MSLPIYFYGTENYPIYFYIILYFTKYIRPRFLGTGTGKSSVLGSELTPNFHTTRIVLFVLC